MAISDVELATAAPRICDDPNADPADLLRLLALWPRPEDNVGKGLDTASPWPHPFDLLSLARNPRLPVERLPDAAELVAQWYSQEGRSGVPLVLQGLSPERVAILALDGSQALREAISSSLMGSGDLRTEWARALAILAEAGRRGTRFPDEEEAAPFPLADSVALVVQLVQEIESSKLSAQEWLDLAVQIDVCRPTGEADRSPCPPAGTGGAHGDASDRTRA